MPLSDARVLCVEQQQQAAYRSSLSLSCVGDETRHGHPCIHSNRRQVDRAPNTTSAAAAADVTASAG